MGARGGGGSALKNLNAENAGIILLMFINIYLTQNIL